MYDKVSSNRNYVESEKRIERFWKENGVFEKSIDDRRDAPSYVFYDGPPTANGKPHIGHVLTRAIKDMIPRYHAMKGCMVPRKAGWDTHGLPVELEVERELGISGKEQIESYGLAPFIAKCKESVWKYKGMWEDFSETVGFWADMENPYVTYHNSFIESEWWALKQIWEKDLLYKGFKVVPYCPRCGTPLSSHEVAQGYRDVEDTSAIAKFRVKGEDAYILAWTTTPWTLPSNVGLCVNAGEEYAKVASGGEVYYLARALCDAVLGEGNYSVLETFAGSTLEYKEYEPLFDLVQTKEKGFYVTCDDYVTLTDGTGVVHTSPAFGEDDARVGRKYGLPFVQLVDKRGQMTAETPWAGVFVKDADALVLRDLKERGQLFKKEKFTHSYPFCWRCDTPLIYYARESWFIRMTAVKDDLIRNNNQINWVPESIGKGRFGDWLENVQDWAISRDRYWGTPLNVWECACGHRHAIGSIEELKRLSANCPDDIELHRPFIDAVTFPCEKCGGEMKRVPEVIDCWFDSGAMPFAQHHYPFENKELFESQFPADFISEAIDQTRGWFYSLLAISTLIFNKPAFKNVVVMGHVQDENGQKMSKSKGNAVDPFETLAKHGADAVRWYFYANSAPWLPNRYHDRAVSEGQRKFLSTLWNTYGFYVLYANIDQFNPATHTVNPAALTVMDRWALSRLHSTVKTVDEHLAAYRITEAARSIAAFVDELSNWYVRRGRERYWAVGLSDDKVAAYKTLHTALVTVAKLAAPMIPFMTEEIYQNLVRNLDAASPESVHLCDYPAADESLMNPTLESEMDRVMQIVVLGRAARNAASLKNRQPLAQMVIHMDSPPSADFLEIVRDELNVHTVRTAEDMSAFMTYTFKPQLRTLGQKYGKRINAIREALANIDGSAAKKALDRDGQLTLALADGDVVLAPEDLLIDAAQTPGYAFASDRGVTVVLDTTLTDALIEEGFVREVVSKVQSMRREADFNVMDRIVLEYSTDTKLGGIIVANRDEIAGEVLADDLVAAEAPAGFVREWDINGEQATLGVRVNK